MNEKSVTMQTRWGAVILLWAIGLAAAMQFAKFSISLSHLSTHYSVDQSVAAFMLSSVGIMGIILGAAVGTLVGVIGSYNSLVTALAIGIIVSLLQASLPVLQLVFASRLFEGISHLLIVVAAPTAMITACAPKHKAFAMGLWATFFGVAFTITGLIGLPLLERFGLSSLFLAHAALLIVLLVLYLLIGKRQQVQNHDLIHEARTVWVTQFAVYKSRRKSVPAFVFFWHTLMFVALLTFLPGLAQGQDTQRFLTTMLPILTIGGSFLGGAIAQQTGQPIRLMVTALIIFSILAVLTGLAHQTGAFVYSACLMMIASGTIQASAFSAVPLLCQTEKDQAQANGAITQLGNLGATCGTPVFAVAISFLGSIAVPSLAALLAFGAVIMLFIIARDGRHAKSPTSPA